MTATDIMGLMKTGQGKSDRKQGITHTGDSVGGGVCEKLVKYLSDHIQAICYFIYFFTINK